MYLTYILSLYPSVWNCITPIGGDISFHVENKFWFTQVFFQCQNLPVESTSYKLLYFGCTQKKKQTKVTLISKNEPPHDKTNKMACAPSDNSDHPGHPPSLIWVFAVHSMGSKEPKLPSWGQRRLIRLGGCPGWSESSLGAHAILWGLSWGGSNAIEKILPGVIIYHIAKVWSKYDTKVMSWFHSLYQ